MSTFGQTHLQDAVPMSLGEELSGYIHQISMTIEDLTTCQSRLYQLPDDDTTLGTANHTPKLWSKNTARIRP
jgi:fumarate hydratase class II